MNFINTLAQLQPILIVGLIILMLGFENIWPYLSRPANKKKHELRNFVLSAISFVVNALGGMIVLAVLTFTAEHNYGLLNNIPIAPGLHIVLGILLIDVVDYSGHILAHKVPILWRSHRVHHSDAHVMTSSSLRFHPFDVLYSQVLMYSIAIFVIGVSPTSFIIYGTIGLILLILQHSNVKFPAWVEKYVRLLFVTPGFHKIHHAADQKYTDSHYATVFSVWDRIFGTYHNVSPNEIEYGLHEFNTDKKQSIGYLLSVPFRTIKRNSNH